MAANAVLARPPAGFHNLVHTLLHVRCGEHLLQGVLANARGPAWRARACSRSEWNAWGRPGAVRHAKPCLRRATCSRLGDAAALAAGIAGFLRSYTARVLDELNEELEQLRRTHATSRPAARLGAIRQRLARAEAETGPTRLVAVVSAVEALARSLVVHAPGRPASSSHFRYQQVRLEAPLELVEEALRLYGAAPAAAQYGEETWQLFGLAHKCRNLVVHECTCLGHDRYPALIAASEQVLEGLVEIGGLPRLVAARA